MRQLNILILLICLNFISLGLKAQQTFRFNNRVDKFPKELEEFMNINLDKERKKETDKTIEIFSLMWMSDTLNEVQKKNIIAMSNTMTQKRLRPYPHFNQFLYTILGMIRNEQGLKLFDDWFKSVEPLLSQKSVSNFQLYLEVSEAIFKENVLYQTPMLKWTISNMDVKIIPNERSPEYIFKNVDLRCITKNDSTSILNTNGTFLPLEAEWVGTKGKVSWQRVEIPEKDVYALLDTYEIKLKGLKYTADSVTFYDLRRFTFPLVGRFSEKVKAGVSEENSYPQFSSYRTDLEISEVFKSVDFKGGYSLWGTKVIGSGNDVSKAYYIFKRNGKPLVYCGAQSFVMLPDRIISDRVTVSIRIDKDSIYHPGLSLTYLDSKKELSIYRMDQGLSMAPFHDSYHNLDLFVESFFWKLDEDFIDLKMIQLPGSIGEAYFESSNYFSQARYEKLQGIDKANPVMALYNLCKKQGYNYVLAEDYGRFLGMSKDVGITLLISLASKGFVIYDVVENSAIVKPKVENYVNSFRGKSDYDVIVFRSSTEGIPNASLNLINYDLMIQGVKNVQLSDSQQVYIYPKRNRVIVKKNRDFVFDGLIKAGRFDLYARECYFSYDKFELDLPVIDSLSFKVNSFTANDYGDKPLVKVKTVIEDLKGNILLDNANNKSGRKSFPEYPILNSKSNSFVYYDRSEIQSGVYSRDKFYYRLETFSIDSLDDFETEGIEFKGYLASAGIFPDITQPLKVQSDYSLGFITQTGSVGLAAYKGKGKFTDKISLSNEGLRGDGSLKYINSTSWSDNFIFFPDSMNSVLQKFKIDERKTGIEYPDVIAENVYEHWEPYKDILLVKTIKKEKPIEMYLKEAKLNGLLTLTPKALTGMGTIFIKDSEMSAALYKFKNYTYSTDTCSFKLKKFIDNSLGMGELASTNEDAYSTEGFKAVIDFKLRKGEFESNGGNQKVSFPENQYICFMDKFTWYMDKDETEFSSAAKQNPNINKMSLKEVVDLDLTGSEFISTHPDQDSLRFFAQKATFSRQKALIRATDVKLIRVADASIFPEKGSVNIFKNAEMEELSNANVVANNVTKYHLIKNATINIRGARSYRGRGIYDYFDENNQVQNIYFSEITVDTTGTTHAKGAIAESAKFTLSQNFDFVGESRIIANKEFLYFEGGTRINHNCDTANKERLYFSAFINPKEIMIPVGEEPKTVDNLDMFASIICNDQGTMIYPAFLNRAGKRTDDVIVNANGWLVYDKVSKEYRISTADKLKQLTLPDNFVCLNKNSCSIIGEGKINIGFDLKPVEMKSFGRVKHYMRLDSTDAYVAILLDFFFNSKAMELMADEINTQTNLPGVNLDDDINKIALGQLFGIEETEKLMTEVATQGGAYKKVPKPIEVSMFFTSVNMKWNPRTRSFVSNGKIGIGNIGKTQINKFVDGIIEVKNKRGNSELTMALQITDEIYYFFTYNTSTGMMAAWSSNTEFVNVIKEVKPEDRKLKVKEKEDKYTYYLSSATAMKKFLREMEIKGR